MKAEKILEALGEIDEKFIEEAMNYNMKKKFNWKPIIAVAACAAFALAAIPVANHFANNNLVDGGTTGTTAGTVAPVPGDEVNFTVYESGVHDSIQPGTHKIELELNRSASNYIDNDRVGKREKVVFDGLEWTAKYTNSTSANDYTAALHRYSGGSNGKKVTFTINSETGKCEYFMINSSGDIDKTVKLTRDEVYELAYNHFISGGYTEDPENYQLTFETSNSAGYCFKFSRFIDGIQTSDCVRIGFRYNGDFHWYDCNRVGEMKDVDVSNIDMNKLYDAAESKVKKIYGDAYVGFERKGAVLTKLTNGSYVFEYRPDVNVKDGNGKLTQDRCILTITMD